MKLLAVGLTFIAYGLLVAAYNGGQSASTNFPTFITPDIEFQDIPDNCGGFTDCVEFVGKIIVNLVLGVVFFVLLILAMLLFLVQLIALLAASAATGVDGAPWWLNVFIIGFFALVLGIIFFRSARKGDMSA